MLLSLTGLFFKLIHSCPILDLWIAFGTGKHFRYIHINEIARNLGAEKARALPAFHSFTGCDTVSAFFGKGKVSAWAAWEHFPAVTEAFTFVAENPFASLETNSKCFKLLESFVVVLYDKKGDLCSVDQVRRKMFCKRDRFDMKSLPPTQGALLQHSRRAIYQASLWYTADRPSQQAPSPERWGWTKDNNDNVWLPLWSELTIASEACNDLVKCSCKAKKGCGPRCSCKKVGLSCTKRCKCCCQATTS